MLSSLMIGFFSSSTSHALQGGVGIQDPFDLVCWQFNQLIAVKQMTDSQDLVSYSSDKNSYEPTTVAHLFRNPSVECVKERGEIILHESRSDLDMTWTETIRPDATGNANAVKFEFNGVDLGGTGLYIFTGDGEGTLKARLEFEASAPSFPKDTWTPVEKFLSNEYKSFDCKVTSDEIIESGANFMTGVESLKKTTEKTFRRKLSGKYSFTEKYVEDNEIIFAMDNGFVVPCLFKPNFEVSATNEKLPTPN
jgi:hypothetical protein